MPRPSRKQQRYEATITRTLEVILDFDTKDVLKGMSPESTASELADGRDYRDWNVVSEDVSIREVP